MGNRVIYRPAYEAEVEYLESTGTQWIDTGIVPTENTRVVAKLYTEQNANKNWFGSERFIDEKDRHSGYAFNQMNGHVEYLFGGSGWKVVSASYSLLNRAFEIDYSNVALKVDDATLATSLCSNFPTQTQSMLIFWRQGASESGRIAGRVYNLKIYQNSTLVRDFIPVRIGQVGYMYDKVSKQLFANKGTGNFILGSDVSNAIIPQQRCVLYFGNQRSVIYERIYEQYQYLKCNDGEIKLPLNSESFSFFVDLTTSDSNVIILKSKTRYTYHYKTNNNNCFLTCWDLNKSKDVIITSTLSNPINIVSTTSSFKVNNISLTKFGFPPKYISARGGHVGEHHILKFSEISIDDSIRYTPCKLLTSIPAILDGNGIARQAGECGMWDKVSGRFYGNVASSGTFTVKGAKCYEEYKWLVADMPIGTSMMTLPVNSDTLYFRRIWKSFGNSSYFITNRYDYYTYFYQKKVSIYDSAGSAVLGNFGSEINVDEVIEIDSNSERMIMHNVEVPKYGFPITSIRLNNGSNGVGSVTHYTSVIFIDGVERYVPCKLIHGIPASMDANGIARPAGTCGMWDKVNDKFYGNVANSGTFTVLNN